MARIKLDMEHIKYMTLFEKITRVQPKDCILNKNSTLFIVESENLGKAIGKKAKNIKILEKKLNKKIKIIKFDKDIIQFTGNLIYPFRNLDITYENDDIIISSSDTKTKGLLIGRNSQNLTRIENIIKRYFKFNKLKII